MVRKTKNSKNCFPHISLFELSKIGKTLNEPYKKIFKMGIAQNFVETYYENGVVKYLHNQEKLNGRLNHIVGSLSDPVVVLG